VDEVERALRLLFKDTSSRDTIVRLVRYLLEKRDGATIGELAEVLNVSYVLVLRAVNELEKLGVVVFDKVKVKPGRGRARKIVKLDVEGLKRLARQHIQTLQAIENL